MRRICLFALAVIWAFIQVGQVYGKGEVPERDYRIAVVLFNEAEYKAAEDKFSTVIEKGDLTIPKAAAYVVNSYYGRASCRIEQGRELKGENKLAEALDKYDEAYSDLAVFKTRFQPAVITLLAAADFIIFPPRNTPVRLVVMIIISVVIFQ